MRFVEQFERQVEILTRISKESRNFSTESRNLESSEPGCFSEEALIFVVVVVVVVVFAVAVQ